MLLLKKSKIKCYQNDICLLNNIEMKYESEILNYDNYKRDYYLKKFNINIDNSEEIDVICDEYLRGMTFVINYYLIGMPTYDWYYPYHYAPLLSDIYNYL